MIHKAWYVICDNCGDPTEISTESVVQARRYAQSDGYVRKRVDGEMKDLCERCSGNATPEREGQRAAISDMQRQNTSGRF